MWFMFSVGGCNDLRNVLWSVIWVSINSNNETKFWNTHSKIVFYLVAENTAYQGVSYIYKNNVPKTSFFSCSIAVLGLGCRIGSKRNMGLSYWRDAFDNCYFLWGWMPSARMAFPLMKKTVVCHLQNKAKWTWWWFSLFFSKHLSWQSFIPGWEETCEERIKQWAPRAPTNRYMKCDIAIQQSSKRNSFLKANLNGCLKTSHYSLLFLHMLMSVVYYFFL